MSQKGNGWQVDLLELSSLCWGQASLPCCFTWPCCVNLTLWQEPR